MVDRIDAVPEADYVEQHIPAYPADQPYPEIYPEDDVLTDRVLESDSEITQLPTDDNGWSASEGDLVEQAIPVPMGDDWESSPS
ncbi:hypothetical protein ACFYUD_26250 [Nocardia tengchongensis]|uniref:hypothetical protein n=1 Tax=Nocardia tengchongensis TaxID=2055889 RepID=UPI00368AC61A